jgi:hypothetical protein
VDKEEGIFTLSFGAEQQQDLVFSSADVADISLALRTNLQAMYPGLEIAENGVAAVCVAALSLFRTARPSALPVLLSASRCVWPCSCCCRGCVIEVRARIVTGPRTDSSAAAGANAADASTCRKAAELAAHWRRGAEARLGL